MASLSTITEKNNLPTTTSTSSSASTDVHIVVQVFVLTSGSTEEFLVDVQSPVAYLKILLHEKMGELPENMILLYNGKEIVSDVLSFLSLLLPSPSPMPIPPVFVLVPKFEEAASSSIQLDLVFCVDCTGSMGSYIKTAQENIIKIVDSLVASESANIEFGLVMYRDHPPQDSTYVTKVNQFTSDYTEMKHYVDQMSPSGGGDAPEAMASGLVECLKLNYRPTATKVCVLIADAPPHGLAGSSGDGFPDGDPNTTDLLEISRSFAEKGIRLYAVAAEPSISSYTEATSWMRWSAELSGGRYVPLVQSTLLTSIIIGGCRVELNTDKLEKEVRAEISKLIKAGYSLSNNIDAKQKIASIIAKELFNRKVTTVELSTNYFPSNSTQFKYYHAFTDSKNLSQAKEKIKNNLFPPFEVSKKEAVGVGVTPTASNDATLQTVTVQEEHVMHILGRIAWEWECQ